jgi:hypothetical protein
MYSRYYQGINKLTVRRQVEEKISKVMTYFEICLSTSSRYV